MRQTVSYETFWRVVTDDGKATCALAGTICHRCEGTGTNVRRGGFCLRCDGEGVIECSPIMDAHHFVPKRRLSTALAKRDTRNGIPLCRDHHDLVEQGFMHSPRPPLLAFFLADHDVADRLVPVARTAIR